MDGLNGKKSENWEKEVLEKLVFATLKEQRSARRWGIFFKLIGLVLILIFIWNIISIGNMSKDEEVTGDHIALIKIEGVIDNTRNNAEKTVIPALQKAFNTKSVSGVILSINSPGGSPVQAGLINDEITRLRSLHPQKNIHVVVHDMCASGGYYIAAAADKIYVNKASVVGSIGVLINGFGFTGIMEKLGVERRLITAGTNKGFLDPFSPQSPEHLAHAKEMIGQVHAQFIEVVRKGRGKRLKETGDMFSGLFWSGEKAIELGLADDYGSINSVARDVFKVKRIVDYTQYEDFSERLLRKFGTAVGEGIANTAINMNASSAQIR